MRYRETSFMILYFDFERIDLNIHLCEALSIVIAIYRWKQTKPPEEEREGMTEKK